MAPRFRLDPELAALNVMIPRLDFDDLPRARALERALSDQGRVPTVGVEGRDLMVPRPDGSQIAVRTYRPAGGGILPALLYLHGGSFMLGGLHSEEDRCELYARDAGCVVVQVDYRLAPEHPFPAAANDCAAVLAWLAAEATNLGVDPMRIAVGGNSAGGGLAAGLALTARSGQLPAVILQLLINPVLDHRSTTWSAREFVDSPVWTRADNLRMWAAYAPEAAAAEQASPVLASDLAGVAAAAIWTAEFDPLRDEGLEYALRLMQAGVAVSLLQYGGTIHGFDSYRMTRVGQRAFADQVLALRSAFTR